VTGRTSLSKMGAKVGRIWLGTSGYAYRHWRGLLFPQKMPTSAWLRRYAEVFETLEVNATFYRLQTRETFERWRRETPRGFRFACKGSRFLTHMKRLLDVETGLSRFYDPLEGLGSKRGPVLFQLPPRMKVDAARLDHFLAHQPRGVRCAVEFRDAVWYDEEVCAVLDRHRAAFCEHDLVDVQPPRHTGGFRYVRFHGTTGKYAGRYGREGLRWWAKELLRWKDAGHEVWVFFNNDTGGHALYDARDLADLLGAPLDLELP
jgi:uncharacterized protein YecE (DUF72 family)